MQMRFTRHAKTKISPRTNIWFLYHPHNGETHHITFYVGRRKAYGL